VFGLHKHWFKLEAVVYASPVPLGGNISGEGENVVTLIERCKFGLTTFVYRCDDPKCSTFKTIEALGRRVDDVKE
jgi:hypothetical protein